ncbi:MAG: MoxR family ATPase [Myxococcales bacterium]|nr:MoxR family ATPase [Myxococcales bacterium]
MSPDAAPDIEAVAETVDRIRAEVGRVLHGQDDVVEQVLIALLARGHVLIQGVPGLGKTLLVRALSRVLGCGTKRIQFTPDLMPSDVTGGNVLDSATGRFTFVPGPIFTQLVLADEINRATPKTQSALLEAMQDRSVSADGVTRPLGAPFIVVATQNPIESQGTYPLPEAQLDRFLLRVEVGHPRPEDETRILRDHLAGFDPADLDAAGLQTVTSADGVCALQRAARGVRVDDALLAYVVDIVGRTRSHRGIEVGASPRAAVALLSAAQAAAALDGRPFVVPDDLKSIAPAVLSHRLVLHPDAEFEGRSAAACLAEILEQAPAPSVQR